MKDDTRTRTQKKMDYNKAAMKQILLTLHKENEADLIEWLDTWENRNGYIKQLIRADMEAHKAEGEEK